MAGHDRVVRDNVHRDIVLDDDISRLVDTRTFQRLRDIKQLATCHYVLKTSPAVRNMKFRYAFIVNRICCSEILSPLKEAEATKEMTR